MNGPAQQLKDEISRRRVEIEESHNGGARGFATCVALTGMMDDAIAGAFSAVSRDVPVHVREGAAVLALGGYGRAELSPYSDIDVMVVYDGGIDRESVEQLAKNLLHLLWDAGLNLGHSVRTPGEAISLHGQELDVWASLLESRYVTGSLALFENFRRELQARAGQGTDEWFVRGVLEDVEDRHERYGNSVKLLEPNIKKSAGGLRDFQALYWLHGASANDRGSAGDALVPASSSFLDRLVSSGAVRHEEADGVRNALEFLHRVRHAMHYLRRSQHDTLEYMLQRELAESRAFSPEGSPLAVEAFMREYHLHARTIQRLHRRLSGEFRDRLRPSRRQHHEGEKAGEYFAVHEDRLTVDPSLRTPPDAKFLFDAFVCAAEHDVDPGEELSAMIERSTGLIGENERNSPEIAALFRRILTSRNVAATLRSMNELNVLGRYIPEFGDLIAFYQYSVYHFYTADEHTLIAIANVERLREHQGILHEVFRNIRRKDVLYLAILLHDIGKPAGVADHEQTGERMARTIIRRLGIRDATDDIAFLVRNHLMMEQVAFRRNLHDPATIREFSGRFSRPELLDYLYLLTYADLSAVNKNVWTEWKASLLQELYLATSEVLRRNLRGKEIETFRRMKHEAKAQDLVERLEGTIPREDVRRHLSGIPDKSYLALFTDEEISRHIQVSRTDEHVSTLFADMEGYTEVTVVAQDAPFLLSRCCAVLSANDANILDAIIFTRDDGMIIDRFRVADRSSRGSLGREACAKIAEDMRRVLEGSLEIGRLFEAHRRRWKRRRDMSAALRVRRDVEFEDSGDYTIVDVYAPDSLGLLYRITETMSRLGLDIYFAKIATRIDGVVDAFYTREREGGPLLDQDRREVVRAELLRTITAMAGQELA